MKVWKGMYLCTFILKPILVGRVFASLCWHARLTHNFTHGLPGTEFWEWRIQANLDFREKIKNREKFLKSRILSSMWRATGQILLFRYILAIQKCSPAIQSFKKLLSLFFWKVAFVKHISNVENKNIYVVLKRSLIIDVIHFTLLWKVAWRICFWFRATFSGTGQQTKQIQLFRLQSACLQNTSE